MKLNSITSTTNPLLKHVRSLHKRSGRDKSGHFLIEGEKVVLEALDKGLDVDEIIVSSGGLLSGLELSHPAIAKVNVVEDAIFSELLDTSGPCKIIAVAQMPKYKEADLFNSKEPLLLVCDAIQDPGNLGTIIRTALAAQASGCIMAKGSVDPFNSKVVRAAAGALFSLPILKDLDSSAIIALLESYGVPIIALDARAPDLFWDANLSGPLAFVVGNEGQGLSPDFMQAAKQKLAIPMSAESESLNASVSASLVIYEVFRQRLQKLPKSDLRGSIGHKERL